MLARPGSPARRTTTAHAEIVALRAAAASVGNYGCRADAVRNVEPCARLGGRVRTDSARVFGCGRSRAAGGSAFDMGARALNHRSASGGKLRGEREMLGVFSAPGAQSGSERGRRTERRDERCEPSARS